jgi:preprotein translocase subunit SecF
MKRIITFSRFFIPAAILSFTLIALGITGYLIMGFNLGVDFQAGLLQEIQFAPTAFSLTYNGSGNASISLSRTSLDIVISGVGVEELSNRFTYISYPTQGDLVRALRGVEGIGVSETGSSSTATSSFVLSAQSSPLLEASRPFVIHYLPPDARQIRIDEVRTSLLSLGTVSVQNLGTPAERRFMIRMEDTAMNSRATGITAERIIAALESTFGAGEVSVTRSDYVGSRFSKQLSDQAAGLLAMTLLLILAYCSVRFKFQYALGAVFGIMHNAIITVGFIVWSRMEFNTTTIAAILTILGYSINDTVVIFDRIRETRRIFPDDTFVSILNRALSETLSRTIITTVTTLLAVFSLFIFTTGSMKDFALTLIIGMITGVYSTIFIASSFVTFWETRKAARGKKKIAADSLPKAAAR